MRGKKDYLDPQVFNFLTNDDEQQLYAALLNNNLLSRLYPEYGTNSLDLSDENGDDTDPSHASVNNLSLLEAINDIDQALTYEKRAPSGFVGMRGKRAPVGFMGKMTSIRGTWTNLTCFSYCFRYAREER